MSMVGKITLCTILVCALAGVIFMTALWQVEEVLTEEPVLVVGSVDSSGVSAKSFVIFDVATGMTLASHNKDVTLPIASVTKLFSAATVLEETALESTTTITWGDIATEGRAGKLEAFTEYTYRDLLWPLLLESSNDAAATLERVEPDLIIKMNHYADLNAASNTHFSDASGLSAENVSTASEIASLVQNLFYRLPYLFDVTQLTQYIGKQTGWINNNPFAKVSEYRGGKHGFTYEANRTGAVIFEETLTSGETQLVGYVVLGSDDLDNDVSILRQQVQLEAQMQ